MSKKAVKLIVLIGALIAVGLAWYFLPARTWIQNLLEWIEGIGFWGPIVVVAIYIVGTPLLFPGSVLTLGSGFLFGLLWGTVVVSIGSTLGACAAFLLGRTVARDWISRKVAENKKFEAVDAAVGQQGFKIVLLTRLSPVFPFNFLNYAFGLTGVKFWKYGLGSWIGMLPGTVMYVYFGAGLRSITEAATGEVETGIAGRIFFWAGLVLAIAIAVFITRIARNALKQHVRYVAEENEEVQ